MLKKTENIDGLSPFGRFNAETKGYKFSTQKGASLDKWEVWFMGFRDVGQLLGNNTKIIARYSGI